MTFNLSQPQRVVNEGIWDQNQASGIGNLFPLFLLPVTRSLLPEPVYLPKNDQSRLKIIFLIQYSHAKNRKSRA
jgi:hypothetical protein